MAPKKPTSKSSVAKPKTPTAKPKSMGKEDKAKATNRASADRDTKPKRNPINIQKGYFSNPARQENYHTTDAGLTGHMSYTIKPHANAKGYVDPFFRPKRNSRKK